MTPKFTIGERVYCSKFPDAHLVVHPPLHSDMRQRQAAVWLQWKSDGEVHLVPEADVQPYRSREDIEAELSQVDKIACALRLDGLDLADKVIQLREALAAVQTHVENAMLVYHTPTTVAGMVCIPFEKLCSQVLVVTVDALETPNHD